MSVAGKSLAPNECEATLGYRLRFTHQEGTEETEEATEKEEEEEEEEGVETEMEAGLDLLTPPHCVILELDALLTPKCGFARQTGQQLSVARILSNLAGDVPQISKPVLVIWSSLMKMMVAPAAT
mgnify:CR=1 FL=1